MTQEEKVKIVKALVNLAEGELRENAEKTLELAKKYILANFSLDAITSRKSFLVILLPNDDIDRAIQEFYDYFSKEENNAS